MQKKHEKLKLITINKNTDLEIQTLETNLFNKTMTINGFKEG